MEEVINKSDNQFKDILNDLIDYTKDSQEKSALIEEVCRTKHSTKPAASLNSSTYSSAASSSSSTSSASDSSTNSASSSSTSSTLSSPSQSSQTNGDNTSKRSTLLNNVYDKIQVAKMEDLGKTARILEHRLALSSEHRTAANGTGLIATSSHSDTRSISQQNISPRLSSSLISQTQADKSAQQHHQQNQLQAVLTQHNVDNITNQTNSSVNVISDNISIANSWKTISGKRDKRRRKPTEQPVLSQHIPGHRGEQEVDWLVNFIESRAGATSNANNSNNNITKKNNKNTKAQPKRQFTQIMEPNRENQQRKFNPTINNNTNKPAPTQTRTPSLHQNQVPTEDSDDLMTNNCTPNDKRVLVSQTAIQPQTIKQQPTLPDHVSESSGESKDMACKPAATHAKRSHEERLDKSKQEDAVVTFADHIRVNDDDVGERYTFGFFEKQQTTIQVKSIKNNESSNNKSSQIGQKYKLKHPKSSLISEQKHYKCNDNVNANSFNYHQILEFISNSWESTAKSHNWRVMT